tara:strand:+ start:313 stop:522 length:210 start_codon:yes stop_codon:yes gene_type:complete
MIKQEWILREWNEGNMIVFLPYGNSRSGSGSYYSLNSEELENIIEEKIKHYESMIQSWKDLRSLRKKDQ